MLREIVFDTETTGFNYDSGDRMIEIGAVELINHLPTGRIYHQYINPEREVPEEVVKVHGLTYDFLKNYPKFAEVAQDFIDFVGDDGILVAHDSRITKLEEKAEELANSLSAIRAENAKQTAMLEILVKDKQ